MSLSHVAHRGSATSPANANTSIGVSPSATIAAGRLAIARVIWDDVGVVTINGDVTYLSVADDAGGNTWVRGAETFRSAGSGVGNGVHAALFYCILTTQLLTSNVVTVTHNNHDGSSLKHGIGLEEIQASSGNVPEFVNFATNTGADTTSPSITISGLTSQEYMLIGHAGLEGPSGDAYTDDADYTALTKFGTSAGAAATNVTSYAEYRVATLTTDTWAITDTTANRDWAGMIVAFREIPTPVSLPPKAQPTLSVINAVNRSRVY